MPTTTHRNYSQKPTGNGRKSKKGNVAFWYDPAQCRVFNEKKELEDLTQDALDRLEYWDSILEWKVYQAIIKVVPTSSVKRHPGLEILPKSACFPAWKWNVDFSIDCGPSKPVLIEAKGQWLLSDDPEKRSFIQTMRMLSILDEQQFNRIILIGDSNWSIPKTNLKVYSTTELSNILFNFNLPF